MPSSLSSRACAGIQPFLGLVIGTHCYTFLYHFKVKESLHLIMIASLVVWNASQSICIAFRLFKWETDLEDEMYSSHVTKFPY